MKIRDTHSYNQKFSSYADYEVEDFITYIKGRISRNERVNTPILKLYNALLAEVEHPRKEEAQEEEVDEVYAALQPLPLDELRFYRDGNINKMCHTRGIHNLGDLYRANFEDRAPERCKEAQSYLREYYETILRDLSDYNQTYIFPEQVEPEKGIIPSLKEAFAQVGHELQNHVRNPRYEQTHRYAGSPGYTNNLEQVAYTLIQIYQNNLDNNGAATQLGVEGETIGGYHRRTIRALLDGETIWHNIKLNDSLAKWAKGIAEQSMFQTLQEANLGSVENNVLRENLGLTIVEISDTGIKFTVPVNQNGKYTSLGEIFVDVMRNKIVPADKEEIESLIKSHSKFKKKVGDYDATFIDNLFKCEKLVGSTDEGQVYILTEHLRTDQHKMVRLIFEHLKYEHVTTITTAEAQSKFEQRYHKRLAGSLSALNGYGVVNRHGGNWGFNISSLAPIQTFVNDFAEERKVFHYKDLEEAMINNGYTIPQSIRVYITKICTSNNDDHDHFCHKEYVEDYPGVNWRQETRSDVSNWILNRIKDALADSDSIAADDLLERIKEAATGTEYEDRIRERFNSTIETYCGTDQPFLKEGDTVKKNPDVLATTDFALIGQKGRKLDFYSQIRAITVNALKRAEGNSMLLTELVELVNENLDETQTRNTILRAITTPHLDSIVEQKNVKGRVYVNLMVGEEIAKAEPIYEITTQEDAEEAVVVEENNPAEGAREEISYRFTLDWDRLTSAFKRELRFYSHWMNSIDFDKAVDKFITFLKGAENTNLSKRLPQSLFEYWYAKTDYYDRDAYLSQLLMYFEGLLAEITFKNENMHQRLNGLGAWMNQFGDMAYSLTMRYDSLRGFERLYKDLHAKRNLIAHGNALDLTSHKLAKAISDFAALYIYTVARYVRD